MEKHAALNFKAGQLAETKSFVEGYRGAWFRCKIKDIQWKKNSMLPEYYDFDPDELIWEKIYQVPPCSIKSKNVKKHLMVRPQYPMRYKKGEMPAVDSISQVCVVYDGNWKVGDLVDWFADGCYWSARVVKVLNKDKFKVELPMPPLGEGKAGEEGIHEADGKDFRPTLKWSETQGWTLPSVEGHTTCGVQLIFPTKQAKSMKLKPNPEPAAAASTTRISAEVDENSEQNEESVKMNCDSAMDLEPKSEPAAAGSTTHISTEEDKDSEQNEKSVKMDCDIGMDLRPKSEPAAAAAVSTTRRSAEEDRDSEQNEKSVKMDCDISMDLGPKSEPAAAAGSTTRRSAEGDRDIEQNETSVKMDCDLTESAESTSSLQKKIAANEVEKRELNIMHEDTLEAAVLDLEELLTKVKWLQRLLKSPSNDATPSSWKFA